MDVPAGMKNPTSGDFSVMLNSVIAAQAKQSFIYRNWEVETPGNPLAHTILRGAVNKHGQNIPNYHYEDLIRLANMYKTNTASSLSAEQGPIIARNLSDLPVITSAISLSRSFFNSATLSGTGKSRLISVGVGSFRINSKLIIISPCIILITAGNNCCLHSYFKNSANNNSINYRKMLVYNQIQCYETEIHKNVK